MNSIGFIQGRLSSLVNGLIQAFPWDNWKNEFCVAKEHGFKIMEWTLDQDYLYENPLMTKNGREEIKSLMLKYNISIPSVTGDCFMQMPFYKFSGDNRKILLKDLHNIIISCGLFGVKNIIFPLVDNGKLETLKQKNILEEGLALFNSELHNYGIKILFESDLSPVRLKDFISGFSSKNYGINYDIGNSAAFNFDPVEEINAYGERILNVHIKDRLLHGTTVPLGQGNADIPKVLKALNEINYNGNYILQTARAIDENHAAVLCKYRDQVIKWME